VAVGVGLAAGFAGFEVDAVAALGAIAPELAAPPAAFSNCFRCVRNSVSFARIAGSRPAGAAAPVVPAAPAVPAVPAVPVVPAVPAVPTAVPAAAVVSVSPGPSSELRFASTLAYAARQSACVVISSLKFEISCETCVRLSP
jgi:hypothetical protein